MQGVGHDEQDGGDVNDEDEAPGWYLPASLIIAEADCLVPVQGYPHQAQAGYVDTRSLDINIKLYCCYAKTSNKMILSIVCLTEYDIGRKAHILIIHARK